MRRTRLQGGAGAGSDLLEMGVQVSRGSCAWESILCPRETGGRSKRIGNPIQ